MPRADAGVRARLTVAVAAAFYFSPIGLESAQPDALVRRGSLGRRAVRCLWRDSLRMAAHARCSATAPRRSPPRFRIIESKELARAYPDFSHESPHNIFLDALVSQGVPGLLCLARGVRPRVPHSRSVARGGVGAAPIVAQQFTVFTIPTALIFYVTVALSAPGEGPCAAA